MNEQAQIILKYLEDAYIGAKMMEDVDTQLRVSRAITALKAPTDMDIFTEEFQKAFVIFDVGISYE